MDVKTARSLNHDELFEKMGEVRTDHYTYLIMAAEAQRRQFKMQTVALDAQLEAAWAEKAAAEAAVTGVLVARRNAWLMLASVVVAAISAIISAIATFGALNH